jgi:hypothetical protein
MSLGDGCGRDNPRTAVIRIGEYTATSITLVSGLACSEAVRQGTEVLRITAVGEGRGSEAFTLRAGRDTAEWAWDRADVRGIVLHDRPSRYESFPSLDAAGETFAGHRYTATFAMELAEPVAEVHLETSSSVEVVLHEVTLRHEATGTRYTVPTLAGLLADRERWQPVEDLESTAVFENRHALPRAWLVPAVMVLDRAGVLHALKESRLPDGARFDPRETALVEEPVAPPEGRDPGARVRILHVAGDRIDVESESAAPAFLVLSDVFLPGWKARIEGRPARVVRTNYVLRGMLVPAGRHRVSLVYQPLSFYLGCAMSVMALVGTALWLVRREVGSTHRGGGRAPPFPLSR